MQCAPCVCTIWAWQLPLSCQKWYHHMTAHSAYGAYPDAAFSMQNWNTGNGPWVIVIAGSYYLTFTIIWNWYEVVYTHTNYCHILCSSRDLPRDSPYYAYSHIVVGMWCSIQRNSDSEVLHSIKFNMYLVVFCEYYYRPQKSRIDDPLPFNQLLLEHALGYVLSKLQFLESLWIQLFIVID